jgi:hypothetical protein
MVLPVTSATTRTFNSSSTPDERGLYFSLPWDVSVSGAWIAMNLAADATVTLYDTDGTTVLRSVALDGDTDSGVTDIFPVMFATPVALTAGAHYRLTVVPTTTTGISIYEWGIENAAHMVGLPGGTDMIGTSRTDAGGWTEANTVRPIMGLMLQGFYASESGGGGGETSSVFG